MQNGPQHPAGGRCGVPGGTITATMHKPRKAAVTESEQRRRRLEYMPLADVLRAPRNPKRHNTELIANSISRFGIVESPAIDERTGRLVAGHGRLDDWVARKAAGENPPDGIDIDPATGEWLVPVQRGWSSRSDADAEAYLVISNSSSTLGGWDDENLAQLLSDLRDQDPDLLDLTGYDGDFISAHWDGDSNPWDHADGEGAHGDNLGGGPANPSLSDRFGIPPFDTLDARSGPWQERKRKWLALDMQSEVGRGQNLAFADISSSDPDYYRLKKEAEQRAGRELSHAEFQAEAYPNGVTGRNTGTSIFDPVLCELSYRWFTAPGATVIDPFAGGSVRGVIAGLLGRRYIGVDLSGEQVAANRAQAAALLPGAATDAAVEADVTDPADLTPIEVHGGYRVKRDDTFHVGGSRGGKVRTALALIGAPGVTGVTTAGSRHSPQVNIVATIAARLGLPCRVHVPSGELTPELLAAQATGAEIVQHTPGYNTVIVARARDDAKERGWVDVPFGMEHPEAIAQTRRQAANLPADVERIVVPVGSGMSLAGILHGLRDAKRRTPVVGVQVGADPTDRLDAYAPKGWRSMVTIVDAGMPYETHADTTVLGELSLDPVYEAKCLPHLQPGDLLWVVGRRATAAGTTRTVAPTWHEGDSGDVLPTFPAESADMIMTCPPYYDLEEYSDNPADLSSMTYDGFDRRYAEILKEAVRVLRPDRFAVIVVGDARDSKGVLHDLRGSTVRAMEAAGCGLVSAGVLITPVGSAAMRAGRQFTATRTLARCHQDVLVFIKGNRQAATAWCGEVEVDVPAETTTEETSA